MPFLASLLCTNITYSNIYVHLKQQTKKIRLILWRDGSLHYVLDINIFFSKYFYLGLPHVIYLLFDDWFNYFKMIHALNFKFSSDNSISSATTKNKVHQQNFMIVSMCWSSSWTERKNNAKMQKGNTHNKKNVRAQEGERKYII